MTQKGKSKTQIRKSSPKVDLDFSRPRNLPGKASFRLTYETVRQIALALANVEDGLSYGAPALKVKKKLFVRLREDLNAIVLKTTFEEREELMAAESTIYFITDHYLKYPYVLVNLERVGLDALGDLIRRSYNLARLEK